MLTLGRHTRKTAKEAKVGVGILSGLHKDRAAAGAGAAAAAPPTVQLPRPGPRLFTNEPPAPRSRIPNFPAGSKRPGPPLRAAPLGATRRNFEAVAARPGRGTHI